MPPKQMCHVRFLFGYIFVTSLLTHGLLLIDFFCFSFLRHWNRGEMNSCSRTDLTFKPVPDSQFARRREERLRRQAERDRDEREKEKERERERAAAHAVIIPSTLFF